MLYDIIYADPPWQYDSGRVLAEKSLLDSEHGSHYGTLSIKELMNIPVGGIASDDSLCFMWIVSPKLKEGIDVMESWGFKYRTIAFVWEKQRVNMGYYTMSGCELCLVGKRGKIPTPRGSRNERQFLSELRKEHSQKPLEFKHRIVKMFPTQKKIELFATERSDGWDAWGNKVGNCKSIFGEENAGTW